MEILRGLTSELRSALDHHRMDVMEGVITEVFAEETLTVSLVEVNQRTGEMVVGLEHPTMVTYGENAVALHLQENLRSALH